MSLGIIHETLVEMKIVKVTSAQVRAAKTVIKRAEEEGRVPDPAVIKIANTEDPSPSPEVLTEREVSERRKAIKVGRYTLYDYWVAPSEPKTDLGYTWTDKRHRLLYDLINEIERLHARITELEGG